MKKATIITPTSAKAKKLCQIYHGWYPDAVRQVDSGMEGIKAWMCFESAEDAELWDRQK